MVCRSPPSTPSGGVRLLRCNCSIIPHRPHNLISASLRSPCGGACRRTRMGNQPGGMWPPYHDDDDSDSDHYRNHFDSDADSFSEDMHDFDPYGGPPKRKLRKTTETGEIEVSSFICLSSGSAPIFPGSGVRACASVDDFFASKSFLASIYGLFFSMEPRSSFCLISIPPQRLSAVRSAFDSVGSCIFKPIFQMLSAFSFDSGVAAVFRAGFARHFAQSLLLLQIFCSIANVL